MIIDALLMYFGMIPGALAIAIFQPFQPGMTAWQSAGAWAFAIGVGYVVPFLLVLVVPAARDSATFGQRLVGLVVVRADSGDEIGFSRALLRCAMLLISIACFGLGLVVALFNPRRQTLHDFIAGTIVVDADQDLVERDRCSHCGYNLQGSGGSDRCPECGAANSTRVDGRFY